uniref:hypothetical protein n=1 Tax=Alistipes shahii TaxID=328814 RepID=UPI00307E5B2E
MNSVFILLNSLNDWKPYCETDSLMTVTDYLEHLQRMLYLLTFGASKTHMHE